MILAYFVLLKNIMRLQEERQKTISLVLITGIAILYPSWLHYSRSTMTDRSYEYVHYHMYADDALFRQS